jgi:hypothetical protein
MDDGNTEAVEALHHEVDRRAARLAARHAARLKCARGCSSCCVDGITVFEVEAARIRGNHADLLASESPHPEGACAFLDDEGACRIYEDRPYVCRTQGLPLRWIDELEDGSPAELRDICPLNDEGVPVEALDEGDCWTLGPAEEQLARLQAATGRPGRRVALRALFVRQD